MKVIMGVEDKGCILPQPDFSQTSSVCHRVQSYLASFSMLMRLLLPSAIFNTELQAIWHANHHDHHFQNQPKAMERRQGAWMLPAALLIECNA